MSYEVLLGDCIESMKKLPAESVDMCVTSPPYYGLRDYGTATWSGGDKNCDHLGKPVKMQVGFNERYTGKAPLNSDKQGELREPFKGICGKCGAKRVDNQLGLEATLGGYIDNMVMVFEEVRRILKPHGTLWLNLGDSYNGSGGAGGDYAKGGLKEGQPKYPGRKEPTLKRKDLMGVPWRVAFALQEAGWYLRQDIIWAKPNCMPEPVKDRCTKNHEYIFLLTKQEKYFYDHEAIKEPVKEESLKRAQNSWDSDHPSTGFHGEGIHTAKMGKRFVNPKGRNKRSVWTVNPKPYKGAHFAVFPPDLIEPCILAGCPHGGTVLDPFGGSGTTAGVAIKHGRKAILCELNEEYAALIPSRIESISQIQKEVLEDKREWI
tara:strand:+ start:1006 stop:2133 length:1128 start_codon:yes stop_codon:yes gene_type:complete